jgi:hypothetical protein
VGTNYYPSAIWATSGALKKERTRAGLLDTQQVGLDAVLERLIQGERAFCRAGALHIVPHQFVRIQFRRVAGQKVQFQFATRGVDITLAPP